MTNYPLLAWSLGRDAYRAGHGIESAPYSDGPMLAAWVKGWEAMRDFDKPTKRKAPDSMTRHRKPEDRLCGTHKLIAAAIVDGPATISELAQRLALPHEGISSVLKGMFRRREVVKLKPKDASKPYRWKLKDRAA